MQAANHNGQYTINNQLPGRYTLKLSGTHDGATKDFTRDVIVPLKGQAAALTLDAAAASSNTASSSSQASQTSRDTDDDDDDDYDDNGVTKTNRTYPSDTSKRNDNHSTSGIVGRWAHTQQLTTTPQATVLGRWFTAMIIF